MKFNIKVEYSGRWLHFPVELVKTTAEFEEYRVSGANRSLVLRNNRPLLRGKGLKKRPPDWRLVEGSINNQSFLDRIIEQVKLNMDKVPVHFESGGKTYKGTLDPVIGMGRDTWYLMVNNRMEGSLISSAQGWHFHPFNKSTLHADLAEHFGRLVEEWSL